MSGLGVLNYSSFDRLILDGNFTIKGSSLATYFDWGYQRIKQLNGYVTINNVTYGPASTRSATITIEPGAARRGADLPKGLYTSVRYKIIDKGDVRAVGDYIGNSYDANLTGQWVTLASTSWYQIPPGDVALDKYVNKSPLWFWLNNQGSSARATVQLEYTYLPEETFRPPVLVDAPCFFNGQTVASGASVTAYQSASVPAGQSCVSQTRMCTNGSLSGSYQYAACSVQAGPDRQAPSASTNLTAAVISSSQINLTWTASTDNVAVTGYKIFRTNVQVGTSTTNIYSDTGLAASTAYRYNVRAFDAVGNYSDSSAVVAITLGASTPAIAVGSRVVTRANLNVRQSASASATKLGTKSVGSQGTVIAGPTTANGRTWWQVNYDNGLNGWSIGDYLVAASAASSPAVGMSAPAPSSQVAAVASVADQIAALQAQLQSLLEQLRSLVAL